MVTSCGGGLVTRAVTVICWASWAKTFGRGPVAASQQAAIRQANVVQAPRPPKSLQQSRLFLDAGRLIRGCIKNGDPSPNEPLPEYKLVVSMLDILWLRPGGCLQFCNISRRPLIDVGKVYRNANG